MDRWMDAYSFCFGANGFICWPDGKSYLKQENLVVSMMSTISHEHALTVKSKTKDN